MKDYEMSPQEKLEKIELIFSSFLEMLPYDYKKYEQEVYPIA